MDSFVINLKTSVERRKNVENMLKNEHLIDYEFIVAVDGREMSEEERKNIFDIEYAEKFYGRDIKPGEIGCALSHQKCYRRIMERNLPYALILEDDISIVENISNNIGYLEKYLNSDIPTVILLSGRFYYTKKEKISNSTRKIGKVIDAYLAHAYLINQNAAKLAIEDRPWFMADNWKYFIKKGIKVYGLIPHVVDQNRGLQSDIMDSLRQFKFKSHFVSRFIRRLWHMLFNIFGHFEKASNLSKDFLTQYT